MENIEAPDPHFMTDLEVIIGNTRVCVVMCVHVCVCVVFLMFICVHMCACVEHVV